MAVFSKEATKNNRSLISALLHSSMHNNGAAVDTGNISTGIRMDRGGYVPQFAAGSGQSAASGGGNNSGSARLDRIENVLHGHTALFEKQARINAIPVTLSRRVEEQENARVVAIRNAANAA